MCDISLKPMLTDHEARLIVQSKNNPKTSLVQQFTQAMNHINIDDSHPPHVIPLTAFCTENALFNPPGAPPMPIHALATMAGSIKQAFPQWKSVLLEYKENADGSATILTQQQLGPMEKDLPAMGPYPAVSLKEASTRAKENANVFPIEVGTYTFNEQGDKIQCGTYEGDIVEVEKNPAISHCGKPVDAWITNHWNRKGDLSDVGFGLLYSLLGVDVSDLQEKGLVE